MATPFRSVLLVVALLGLTGPTAAASGSDASTAIERTPLQDDSDVPIDCYANESDRPARPGTAPPNYSHGDASQYFRSMWSGDPDYSTLTESDRDGGDNLAPMSTCQSDRVFKQPPDAVAWNDPEHESYRGSSKKFAARPTGVGWDWWAGGGYIRDSYVAIFSISPSTVVHQQDGTQRFAAPNGTVRAIVDYRLREPSDSDKTLNNYSTETKLYVNGTEVDSSSSDSPELEYKDISGTAELRVETSISATIKTVTTGISYRVINGTKEPYIDHEFSYTTYTQTLSDTETVRVQNLSGLAVEGGAGTIHQPGAPVNDTVVGVSIPGVWRSLESESGYRVHNEWRYYTRADASWTEWETSGEGPEDDEYDGIRPLEVHAVPVTDQPEVTRWRLGEQRGNDRFEPDLHANVTQATMAPQPSLPPEINIEREPESPTDTHLRIWSTESLRNTGDFQINGIVRGHSVPTSELTPIREVNITADVVSESEDQTDLKVLVETQAGDPVKQGQLTIKTREATVQRSLSGTGGEVVVTLPHDEYESSQIQYVPAKLFWRQSGDGAVRETTVPHHPGSDFWEFTKILDLIVVTVLWFLPLGLLLYGLDVMSNGKLLRWVNP